MNIFNIFKKKYILVTHDGSFHADDIFATAALSLLLKGRVKILRARDKETIAKGDYVYDTGGIYDPAQNKFDHHQEGGAGERPNGVQYSSFGLIWKKFGTELCGSEGVAVWLDKKMVQPIDAGDNGVDYTKSLIDNLYPYDFGLILQSFQPSWNEPLFNVNRQFFKMVCLAKKILAREIKKTQDFFAGKKILQAVYDQAEDKRLMVIDENFSRHEIWDFYDNYPEVLFIVYKNLEDSRWRLVAMRKNPSSYENRKDLPASWGGKREKELAAITGVKDAVFCHRGLFLASARTKEGAVKLAQIALNS